MSAIRDILTEAPSRGIFIRLADEDVDQLVITGAGVTEQFLRWATSHKPEILEALITPRAKKSYWWYGSEDELLDQVRSGIGGSLDEVRTVLAHDLTDLFSGALPIEVARHYYRHNRIGREPIDLLPEGIEVQTARIRCRTCDRIFYGASWKRICSACYRRLKENELVAAEEGCYDEETDNDEETT